MLIQVLAFALVFALPPMKSAKDEFVFNNKAEVETLDPHVATGTPDNNIIIQMFEGLMTRKADWATITPGAAESYKVSKDGLTFTFKLRPNLKWSDGSKLTAKDFEYSFHRAVDPQTIAQYAYWFTDTIVGMKEYAAKPSVATQKATGVKAIDDQTLQIKLKQPVPYLLQILAESLAFPVKKDVVEKFGSQWTRPANIVSNGPFKLIEWKVAEKIVLERDPHFYDSANVKIKKIVAIPVVERQTAVDLFKQGRLDWSGYNGAPNAMVPAFKSDPNFRMNPGFITYLYRFNTTRPPLNDIRVRQALSLAINRSEIVEKVTRAGEIPASALVPSGVGTYKNAPGIVSADTKANIERAKKLLADAGFPGGKGLRKLTIHYNTDENHKRVALAIQNMWKRDLGIEVEPFNQEWKVYLKAQESLDYDISRSGWAGDYPDPATFLELFQSTSDNNMTGWKNKTYDELFSEANRTMDPNKRNDILQKAETILLDESPIAPIFFMTNFSFIRPEVQGFAPNLIDRPYVRYMSKK